LVVQPVVIAALCASSEDEAMSYAYAQEKTRLFDDRGQRLFIGMRDRILSVLKQAGAVRSGELMHLPDGVGAADSWTMLAVFDRMVELGELREIQQSGYVAGQHRIFVSGK
jgi:hypothetical protein